MYCGNCGHQMKDGDKFCTNCGFNNNQNEKNEKSKEADDKKKEEVIEEKTIDENKTITQGAKSQEPAPVIGIFALIFTFLFSPIGLILGIISIVKGKEVKANKALGIVATIISALSILLTIIIISIVIVAYTNTSSRIKDYDDDYKDYIDKADAVDAKIKGKWTCTTSTGQESFTITFKANNDFNATNGNDKIEGNYYTYEDYSNKNKISLSMYYYDDDEYISTKADFIKQADNKGVFILENQVFNCLK